MKGRIGVIGSGVAGLSTAYFLKKKGFSPVVFEAADTFGGLASTFEIEPSVFIERFYHFICKPDIYLIELAEELGIASRIRWCDTKMALYHGGKLHPFGTPIDLLRFSPLSLADRVRAGIHILKSRRIKDWHDLDRQTAESWLRKELGEEGFRVIWEPLLSMKFGERYREVSAAWIWSRIARVAKSRNGFRQHERLGYFEGGTRTLLTALMEALRDDVVLGAKVAKIEIQDGAVKGLWVNGRLEPVDAVVSTVPLRLLAELAPDMSAEYRKQLTEIEYLGVTCLLLKLKRSFGRYFWTNVSDPDIPFAGIIEYTKLNPVHELHGRSLVYIPHYLSPTEERFEWDLERTLSEVIPALKRLNPDFREADISEAYLNKSSHAQVVCRVGFSALVPPFHAPARRLYVTDSTQLYPEDRVISDLIRCAREVSRLVELSSLESS